MALVERDIENAIAMVNEKVMDYIGENKFIIISSCVDERATIRNTVLLQDFLLSKDRICFECEWFEFKVDDKLIDIQYIEDLNEINIYFERSEFTLGF